ncbi:MAG: siderophore-interacting protein [Actinomycetota bacterium]|nr:siderophore-interacting protein [Actinomycetota bacterium]
MPAKPVRTPIVTTVATTERITPTLIRITVEGDALDGFPVGEFTDHYVKLQFPPPGAGYRVPFDPAEIRASRPREEWHRQRTYTVRAFDPDTGRLTIDFIVHGDEGLAGPWAATARPGDLLQLVGPGGDYSPDPAADWHLLAGDESVLPAAAVALERVPDGAVVFAMFEVEDAREEVPLPGPGNLKLTWLHRQGRERSPDPLLDAVRNLELPPGRGQGFVHGEATMVREIRKHLLTERGMERSDLSATGYWKYRRTEEGWREDKPEWKRQAELDLAGTA